MAIEQTVSLMIEQPKSWIANIETDPSDPAVALLIFPSECLESVGWREGDEIEWKDNQNGTFSLTKKNIKGDG